MPSFHQVSRAALRNTAAAVLLALVWLAMLHFGRGDLDRSVYEALYAGRRPALVVIARIFTALGEPTVLIFAGFVLAGWLWHKGRSRFALALLLVVLVGRGMSEVQKISVARPRPDLEPHLVVVKSASFPSGHATSSMIFFLTLAIALSARARWRPHAIAGAILVSLLIGTSRVMLGVHWPSDVIAGWSFGLLWVLLTMPRAERIFGSEARAVTDMPRDRGAVLDNPTDPREEGS